MDELEKQIEEFTHSMNFRFSDLESRLSDLIPIANSHSVIQLQISNMSLTQVEMPETTDDPIDWDKFSDLIQTNPEDAILDMINFLRGQLNKKASTKRLIEKANSQYVDTSFQRVSTQLTAMINQSILKNHNHLVAEISDIQLEIDDLQSTISQEFEEIKQMIADCRKTKEEVKKDIYQDTYTIDQFPTRNRFRNSSLAASPQNRSQLSKQMLLRPRKSGSTQKFSATLSNSLKQSPK